VVILCYYYFLWSVVACVEKEKETRNNDDDFPSTPMTMLLERDLSRVETVSDRTHEGQTEE